MAYERTLLMIKPDGVRRGLVGFVITRVEQKGLAITHMRMFRMDPGFVSAFYAEHTGKAFFSSLCSLMTSGAVVALQIESEDAIAVIRTMIGVTQPKDRLPGTIRGDFSNELTANIVHASTTPADAERELQLIFGKEE